MKPPHVGFYVHYHGQGHKHRVEAILQHLTVTASVVTSRLDSQAWHGPTLQEVVGIACDNDAVNDHGMNHAGDVPALHYAPLWTDSITQRVASYTSWLAERRPDVMVVDVSAEISMLTRLASIPQIVVRQHGRRDDPGHLNAYAAAHSLLAPFPAIIEDDITPGWVRDKTVYLNGFCRKKRSNQSSDTSVVSDDHSNHSASKHIVCLFGRGGKDDPSDRLIDAAKATSESRWTVVGKQSPEARSLPPNLHFVGWQSDPTPWLEAADIVVTAAGHNSVMEVGSLAKPMVAIAEPRPFDEQVRKVAVLQREGLAVGLSDWPEAVHWKNIFDEARCLDTTKWRTVFNSDGGEQAADHIAEVALWSHEQRQTSEVIYL